MSDDVDAAIGNIADGVPVDWRVVDVSAERSGQSGWVKHLHIIQHIANFYRLSGYEAPDPAHGSDAQPLSEEPTVEVIVGEAQAARYQAGLRQLARVDRRAVIGRLELLTDYRDLGTVLGLRGGDGRVIALAARHAVTRALKHLAIEMGHV